MGLIQSYVKVIFVGFNQLFFTTYRRVYNFAGPPTPHLSLRPREPMEPKPMGGQPMGPKPM